MKTFLTASAITMALAFFIYWLFGFSFERGTPLGATSVISVVIIVVVTAIREGKL